MIKDVGSWVEPYYTRGRKMSKRENWLRNYPTDYIQSYTLFVDIEVCPVNWASESASENWNESATIKRFIIEEFNIVFE